MTANAATPGLPKPPKTQAPSSVITQPVAKKILWMLQRFHSFDCTKDKDRLHAIVSLWKSDEMPNVFNISSEYALSCEDLYTDFAIRFLSARLQNSQATGQFLSIVADQATSDRHNSEDLLSSWVVDWRLQPALNIDLDLVRGNVNLPQTSSPSRKELLVSTKCYGTVVETQGHYRDWTLLTATGILIPSSEGLLSVDEYVTSLSRLCTKLEPGDMLCQPYAQYRGRLGHVADASIVL